MGRIWFNSESNKSNHFHEHHHEVKVCDALFNDALKTKNVSWPPPLAPGNDIIDYFTMRKSHYADWYFAQLYNGGGGYDWNSQVIEKFRSQPNTCGGYRKAVCRETMDKYENYIRGKVGIVIGSETPWAEAALLNHGAEKIITIEYMEITTNYPALATYHPSKVAELYLRKEWKPVDLVFSFSSLEHDGLGRYGDPISPFSDLESVARARCLLKPHGIFMLGLPVALDTVVFSLIFNYFLDNLSNIRKRNRCGMRIELTGNTGFHC